MVIEAAPHHSGRRAQSANRVLSMAPPAGRGGGKVLHSKNAPVASPACGRYPQLRKGPAASAAATERDSPPAQVPERLAGSMGLDERPSVLDSCGSRMASGSISGPSLRNSS
jgi:hypothetical protein